MTGWVVLAHLLGASSGSSLVSVSPLVALQSGIGSTELTLDIIIVFVIIAVAVVLFVTEPIPIDVTAIAVMVSLIALQPWTAVGVADGLSGFSSLATITVLATFILSDGIRRTGVINLIGR